MKLIPERDMFARADAQQINENFKELAATYGLELEMINCGEYPGDCTSEPIRSAMQKINRNFLKLATVSPES